MSIHSEIRHFYCCIECVMQEGRLDDSYLRSEKEKEKTTSLDINFIITSP